MLCSPARSIRSGIATHYSLAALIIISTASTGLYRSRNVSRICSTASAGPKRPERLAISCTASACRGLRATASFANSRALSLGHGGTPLHELGAIGISGASLTYVARRAGSFRPATRGLCDREAPTQYPIASLVLGLTAAQHEEDRAERQCEQSEQQRPADRDAGHCERGTRGSRREDLDRQVHLTR